MNGNETFTSLFDIDWSGKREPELLGDTLNDKVCYFIQRVVSDQVMLEQDINHTLSIKEVTPYWVEPFVEIFKTKLSHLSDEYVWTQHRLTIPPSFRTCLLLCSDDVIRGSFRKLLGVTMALLSDHIAESRLIGYDCLRHLIDKIDTKTLLSMGYNEAIHERLRNCLLLDPIMPPFEVFQMLILKTETKLSPLYVKKFDWLLHHCVKEITLGNNTEARLRHLQGLISCLEHFTIRFLSHILNALEIAFEEQNADVQSVIDALYLHCSDRMPHYEERLASRFFHQKSSLKNKPRQMVEA